MYFIALIPEKEFSEKVRKLQEGLREEHGISYAMRLPPHITLQAPFQCQPGLEKNLMECMAKFRSEFQGLSLKANNFGSFIQPVIFVSLEKNTCLHALQEEITEELTRAGCLVAAQRNNNYHPHISLAYRDLTPEKHAEIWPSFESRKLEDPFEAKSLVLFKHSGFQWEVVNSLEPRAEFA